MERAELKAFGKKRFKENYWTCVLSALLVTAVFGAIGMVSAKTGTYNISQNEPGSVSFNFTAGPGSLLVLLLSGPLTIGLKYLYTQNIKGMVQDLSVTTPFRKAFENYPRKLGGALLIELRVFLWSLLFIIPGMVKAISYSMAWYILADCPNVKAVDAIKLSMKMMQGHKMEFFTLELSFIGWIILSAFTVGIVGFFYTAPYIENTFAAYYLNLKEESIRAGVITADQLR